MIDKWEIVIGCEIHTQLLTKTKAFCACENKYGGIPDTRVCPVCLGLPGAMPRISNECKYRQVRVERIHLEEDVRKYRSLLLRNLQLCFIILNRSNNHNLKVKRFIKFFIL